MNTLPLSAVDAAYIEAARREHPAIFKGVASRLPMWGLWALVIVYLCASL